MGLDFTEIMLVLMFLALLTAVFLLFRQAEKSNEKLENSFPPETKGLVESLSGIIIELAARSKNTIDDAAARHYVLYLHGKGITLPAADLAKIGMKPEDLPVVEVKPAQTA